MKQKFNKTVLIITDGIGYNQDNYFNAFALAKKPTYDYLFKNVPFSLIQTSGNAVGLPDGQMGNSEVGHMCIGSGRILYQNLVKISMAIKDNSLEKKEPLQKLFTSSNNIHIVGLISDGGVHSHIEHIINLVEIAERNSKKVFLHVITDGRDVSPTSGQIFIKELMQICNENIKIATISGRFFTMDRDNRWERVEKAYKVIVNGENKTNLSPIEYIQNMYKHNITDEFIEPASFSEYSYMQEDDGILFANFRNDRMKEIVKAIASNDFEGFARKKVYKNILTMTQYDKTFNYPVIFPNEDIKETLAEVISNAGASQFHTAETEKYAHVTFFFNGGVETPVLNETRVLIPSPKVKTYDEIPQMSAPQVGETVLKAMDEEYDFIIVNFANGDMVGHTGDFDAAIKAVEAVDAELGKILEKSKDKNYKVVITSDHGNCEAMKDKNGNPLTNHTTFDVFCFISSPEVKNVKDGGLSNIAATILKLMNIDKPKIMNDALF